MSYLIQNFFCKINKNNIVYVFLMFCVIPYRGFYINIRIRYENTLTWITDEAISISYRNTQTKQRCLFSLKYLLILVFLLYFHCFNFFLSHVQICTFCSQANKTFSQIFTLCKMLIFFICFS